MEIRFVLRGAEGACQFVMSCGWHSGPNRRALLLEELEWAAHYSTPLFFGPTAYDLGYHARTPRYDGQAVRESCEYLDGDPCYYDGSGLRAEGVLKDFLREGDAAVWRHLEAEYADLFLDSTKG